MDFSGIKAIAFDVDGVFTDGGILCDLQGELFRTFDAKDGFAVRMAVMHGYPCAVITGGRSKSILERFRTVGMKDEDIYLGCRIKSEQLEDFCRRHSLSFDEVLFIGDDIPDIPALEVCGIAYCPADAVPEVKAVCDVVSSCRGGRGCVREAVEAVMKAHGDWTFDPKLYKRMF
ncbi:MAG: HAD hydrolase family protein [Bacteroidales bacterium]|nr:HAD hydrolase family protein [Bacteroidales bacterium]